MGEASASRKARVLVVDDHPIVRQGVAQLINHEADLAVCAEADSAAEAVRAVAESRPDVAVVDLSLREASGLELLKDLKVRFPRLPVLVLSMYDESVYAERALRAGARGYIMKEAPPEQVLEAIRRVLAGEVYLSGAASSRLLKRLTAGRPREVQSPMDGLSDRELEVFRLIGAGLGNKEVARRLHLSPKTIDTYRARLKEKLGLASAKELLRHAIQWTRGAGREP